MPRRNRVVYSNAFYHVMNRGKDHQRIFHDERYYQEFLDVLGQASERFTAIFHAYCLMGNHYHLLVQTPESNISRIMRHINGVYTQKYNRLAGTDGSLFRGRFKAIVVDEDAYLLQLSRYIHLNPIANKKPLVTHLENYRWSSYRAYLGKTHAPDWLVRDMTYQLLGPSTSFKQYQTFVEQELDDEIKQFYKAYPTEAVLGNKAFKEALILNIPNIENNLCDGYIFKKIDVEQIVNWVAQIFQVEKTIILTAKSYGKGVNTPRKFAMYCCQSHTNMSLQTIAEHFGLSSRGSVSCVIFDIKKQLKKGLLTRELKQLKQLIAKYRQ